MAYAYIKPGVSKKAITDFLNNEKENYNTDIHAFSIIRNGELLCRVAVPPYEIGDKKQLFSLSKSFCSTAVGFAVDEGLFKVTDRIVDIFPDDVPEVISEKLSKMTIHNVLSMSTGHKSCVMNVMKDAENPVKAFMSVELEYNPGEKFVYNTGATLLASIIVQKYTGKTVYDYLYEKYFRYLDSVPEKWDVIPAGYCEGGVGLYANLYDIENLGKLYLGKGVLGGRRFLSEEWVNMATSKQIDNSGNGTEDWCSGYGYQFWRNSRDGFRGDGAYGQLCFVMPATDTIISIQCECGASMQDEVDGVYKLYETILDNEQISDDEFSDFIDNFYADEKIEVCSFAGFDKKFALIENTHNIKYIEFVNTDSKIEIKLIGKANIQTIYAGNGEHISNSIHLCGFKPTITSLIPERVEECRFACSIVGCTEEKLSVKLRYKNAPSSVVIDFIVENDALKINYTCRTGAVAEEAKNITGKILM